MNHIDLFSGIGGFALAVDTVWPNSTHTFCEIDPYCRAVLQKHWPQSHIHEDIRTFTNTTDARIERMQERENEVFLLTGGFPCQPFSQAGQRRGTADDRHLWPEMFRVIQEFAPEWVIAENVRGLVTWSEGLVLEQVCTDLENEGYEVQPIIIPAVAVNAPHRRDRVWIIANRTGKSGDPDTGNTGLQGSQRPESYGGGKKVAYGATAECSGTYDATNTPRIYEQWAESEGNGGGRSKGQNRNESWDENWLEVATKLCGVDDGLPVELDGLKLSKAGHRRERLKALGNAIVPQVAIQIMQSIKQS